MGKKVDLGSCGYQIVSDAPGAERLEWEHVVPASAFGQSFKAWRDGHPDCESSRGRSFKGRNCARKTSIKFRLMEADLYNLQPAIGEVNGRRGAFSMGMISGEPRKFGACDVEIEDQKIEPAPSIRGDIVRTYFYMNKAYPGHGIVSGRNRKLFEAWDREDPIDEWERERASGSSAFRATATASFWVRRRQNWHGLRQQPRRSGAIGEAKSITVLTAQHLTGYPRPIASSSRTTQRP